ncbi:MAG: zf-HC2 domain-containing protein [Candidatus Solibacter usitatus]|nr:zf-HC2 domain-containing protein [Candidatus Solibacter usitatus]
MNCDAAKERMSERWLHGLDESRRIELETHLAACPSCREESTALNALWQAMEDVPTEEPGRQLRAGFEWMMQAYRMGVAESSVRKRIAAPRQPLWQLAVASLTLVFGLVAGHLYTARTQDQATIAQLGVEMKTMKHLVTLSLLRQESAGDRLRGVSFSESMSATDDEVLSALVRALSNDPNVNVRLAAFDALTRNPASPSVRKGIRDAITYQESPLLQIALIDWAVNNKDRGAMDPLRQLERQPELHPAVRVRLREAIRSFQ